MIADDFTGAAEICGIGLRHRLNVILETEAIKHKDVDLLVVATDTRSMSKDEAEQVVAGITKELKALNPRFIFKKLDSVLRGNVYAELKAQMDASGTEKALIVAGNPVFGRVIKNGCYYINDIPLHQTGFASDPDYPVNSERVADIIGSGEYGLAVGLKPEGTMPEKGIGVCDVTGFDDLDKWAARIGRDTVPAGASGFFNAMLLHETTLNSRQSLGSVPFGKKMLYVLGSSYPKDESFLSQLGENNLYVSNMPAEIYYGDKTEEKWIESWASDIVEGLASNMRVVALVSHVSKADYCLSCKVKEAFGQVTKAVLARTEVNELLVEGGSTVSAILKCIDIKKLFPIQELSTGIIRMKVDEFPQMYLTTKPGSYKWPEEVWGNNHLKTV